jgi:hypothetical protein
MTGVIIELHRNEPSRGKRARRSKPVVPLGLETIQRSRAVNYWRGAPKADTAPPALTFCGIGLCSLAWNPVSGDQSSRHLKNLTARTKTTSEMTMRTAISTSAAEMFP